MIQNETETQRVIPLLPVVRRMARAMARVLPRQIELDELIAAGNLGLATAAHRFVGDESLFRMYAEQRIRGAMRDQLRSYDVLSRQQRRRVRELQSAEGELTGRLGRAPQTAELAKELGVSGDAVEKRRTSADFRVDSLDWEHVDAGGQSPEEHVISLDEWRQLNRAMKQLPKREREIVEMTCLEDTRLGEVGSRLGVTASRISQLRQRALTQLRGALQSVPPPPDFDCAA